MTGTSISELIKARTAAKSNLTRKITALKLLSDSSTATEWKAVWSAVTTAADDVQLSHDVYIEALIDAAEDGELTEQKATKEAAWLKTELDRIQQAEQSCIEGHRAATVKSIKLALQLNQARYSELDTKVRALMNIGDSPKPSEGTTDTVRTLLTDVQMCRREIEDAQKSLMEYASPEDTGSATLWATDLWKSYCDVKTVGEQFLTKFETSAHQNISPSPSHADSSRSPSHAGSTSSTAGSAVHMKRIEPPTFDGSHRSYIDWARRFKALVIPGRNPHEICQLVWDAVPQEHRHLLQNIDLT